MKVTHRHVAQGSNNPEKQVSLDRWNDAHRIFAALAGSLPEDTGELVIRKTGPRSIELVLRDDDGVDRPFPIDPIASTRTFDQFAGSNMDGLLAGLKVTTALSPRFAGAWRSRDVGNVVWYFAFLAMVLAPNVFTIADRQTCAQVAIDRATVIPRQSSATYGQFTLVTFPSGKVFFCNTGTTTSASAPVDTGATVAGNFIYESSSGTGDVIWEYTGLQVPVTWQCFILDVFTNLATLVLPDSNDSYAAMLAALCETSGVDAAWLNTASAHPGLSRMDVINALIQNNMTDELNGTSPGPRLAQTFQHGVKGDGTPYADIRFLADNVEVWRGYRAQSALLARLSLSTTTADQNAADVKAGVLSLHVGGRFQRFEGQDPDHLAIAGDAAVFSDWQFYLMPALHGMLTTLAEWQTYADAVLADTRANVPGMFTAVLDDFPLGQWYFAAAERLGLTLAAETLLWRVTSRAVEFVPIVDAALAIQLARRPEPEQQASGGFGPVGPAGPPGADGADGATGPAGPGVPTGGTTGQVLQKNSATNYDTGWTTPSGGGSPGGATGEIQFNNAGAFGGAADVEIEGGQLRLPAIATPATPAANGVKLFGRTMGGFTMPGTAFPTGRALSLQSSFSETQLSWWQATGNGGTDTQSGFVAGSTGTSTAVTVATTNFRTRMRWREWLVTTASTTAVAGFRGGALQYTVGADIANAGGFFMALIWSPATGVVSTHRAFAGMRNTVAAPTDVNPSTILNMCGMGYDSADANIQFMHNDGSGTATKIDLGASFPKPSADRTKVYQLFLYSPPGTTQSVSYLVRDMGTGDEASGTVTTDLPSTTTLIAPYAYMSVAGVSSVIGLGVRQIIMETDY